MKKSQTNKTNIKEKQNMTKERKPKKERYEVLADQVYDLIADKSFTYGDILAAIELAKLWIYRDFTEMQLEEQNNTVDTIEVKE